MIKASIRVAIGGADTELRTLIGKGIEFVDHYVLKSTVAQGFTFFYGVKPTYLALTPCGDTKFAFFKSNSQWVFCGHFGEEKMGANLSIVGLAATDSVNRLSRNAG